MSTAEQRGVASLPAIIALAKTYNLDAAAFVFTFKAMAMPTPHSEPEFVACCLVAREHGLNPLTKEIYFMKTKAGSIQPIVSVDGWIKKCNAHPQFDGVEFKDHVNDSGHITAITCSIYRKDRSRPTSITEYMSECAAQSGPWKSHPARMLRHRSIMQCARIAFGFAGIMDRDEFEQWQMRDVTPANTLIEPPEPDAPAPSVDATPVDVSTPVADEMVDADGFLTMLREHVIACDGDKALLQEVLDHNEAMIARLPRAKKSEAEALFRGL